MSFKSSLNALLHNSAYFAMPASDYTTMQLDGDNVVAPSSGYFTIRFKAITAMSSWLGASFGGINLLTNGSFFQDGSTEIMFPVRKGYRVVITSYQADVEYIHFHKLVGGGILKVYQGVIAFYEGGAICLKTSCKRLLNPSSRARRATLQRSACQTGILYIRNLLIRKVVRQRRLADGAESKHIVVGCKVIQTVFSLLLPIKTKIGHVCLYLYKKGKPSIGMLKDWSKEMLVCGLPTTRQTNSLTAKEVCHA